MSKKQRNISISIKATFGSDFQEKFGIETLPNIIQAWADFCRGTHRGTSIDYKIKGVVVEPEESVKEAPKKRGRKPGSKNKILRHIPVISEPVAKKGKTNGRKVLDGKTTK